jgi:hypothetical protein
LSALLPVPGERRPNVAADYEIHRAALPEPKQESFKTAISSVRNRYVALSINKKALQLQEADLAALEKGTVDEPAPPLLPEKRAHDNRLKARNAPTARNEGMQRADAPQSTTRTTTVDLRYATQAYNKILERFRATTQLSSITGPLTAPVMAVIEPTAPPTQLSALHRTQYSAYLAAEAADVVKNDQTLKNWFDAQGIEKVYTSGHGNNCLIRALLQHATGNYDDQYFRKVENYRKKLEETFPGLRPDAMLDAWSLETDYLVQEINKDYDVNLQPAFVQYYEHGNPYVTQVERIGSMPVPIWYSSNHYQALRVKALAAAAPGPSTAQP